MDKYIDANKLIAEIERQQRKLMVLSSHTRQLDMKQNYALQNGVYLYILGIITSLHREKSEVDFEKELKNEKAKLSDAFGPMNGEQSLAIRNFASHFWDKGYNARKYV